MNPQQEAIALWRYIESRGQKPTHRIVASVLRSWGLKFRECDLNAWLKPFRVVSRKQMGNAPETSGKQKTRTRETNGKRPGNAPVTLRLFLRARAAKVSLVTNAVPSDDSLRSSSSAQPAVPAKPTRKPKAIRLPLSAEAQIAKSAILEAVWLLLEPHIGRAMTKTTWKQRNAKEALELANMHRALDEITAAWHSASERLGSPCRMLRIVQDELAKIDSGEITDCGCSLGRLDCDRLHRQHNNTTDALPTIPELEAACSL